MSRGVPHCHPVWTCDCHPVWTLSCHPMWTLSCHPLWTCNDVPPLGPLPPLPRDPSSSGAVAAAAPGHVSPMTSCRQQSSYLVPRPDGWTRPGPAISPSAPVSPPTSL
eukprot:scaffold20015_cov55-Cyclotella_meneghiniana.AAC.2